MANLNRNFGLLTKTPTIDRENIHPGFSHFAGKENQTERRHTGRKQAFGELKNVLNNQAPTPLKGQNIKNTPLLINTKKDANINKLCSKPQQPSTVPTKTFMSNQKSVNSKNVKNKHPKAEYEELEYNWSKQSVLTDAEIERIVNGDPEEQKPCTLPPKFFSFFDPIFGDFDEKDPPKDDFELNLSMPDFPNDEWSDFLKNL